MSQARSDKIQAELQGVLRRASEDLLAILITDKDGVIILRATQEGLPSQVLEPAFTASFLLTSDQMAKIGFGKTKQVIGITGSYSIAQFASPPLTLTLLAKHDANLGIVVDMGHELRPIVEAVANSLEN